jgi:hypothetical protein
MKKLNIITLMLTLSIATVTYADSSEPQKYKEEQREDALQEADAAKRDALAIFVNAPRLKNSPKVWEASTEAHDRLQQLYYQVDAMRYGSQLIGEMYGYCAPVMECNQNYSISNDARVAQMKWLDELNYIKAELKKTNVAKGKTVTPEEEEYRAERFFTWTSNLVKTADWVYDILDNKLRYPVIYEIDKEFTRTSAKELLNWAMKVYNDQLNLRESYTEEGAEKLYKDTLAQINAKYISKIALINASHALEKNSHNLSDAHSKENAKTIKENRRIKRERIIKELQRMMNKYNKLQ